MNSFHRSCCKVMNFIKDSVYYRDEFAERSCKNCANRGRCKAIVGKDWTYPWLDSAKCGCRIYVKDEQVQ